VRNVRVRRASPEGKVSQSFLDVKPSPGVTDEPKSQPPEVLFEVEVAMSASERERALARVQARRRQVERELARVERKIVRVRGQVLAVQERMASLTLTHRRAA
jgi:hypothetical protein